MRNDFLMSIFGPNDEQQKKAAEQFGTDMGTDQTKQLAEQEAAFANNATRVPNTGFDLKGFAQDLSKATKGTDFDFGESLYNQKINNIGLLQMPQAPQQAPTAPVVAAQPQQSAMQAIQGGMPSNPLLDQMLRNLGYGR